MPGNKTISSVLMPLQQRPLLLPAACIVEVLDYTRPADRFPEVNWLLGETSWRGLTLPVISFELLNLGRFSEFSATNRIAIIRRTSQNGTTPFYGMVIQGLPQPLEIRYSQLQLASNETGPAEKARVFFKELPATLPDMPLIEHKLETILAQANIPVIA